MANKNPTFNLRDKVYIKYVRKALSWCKTTFPDGIQKQEWSREKPVI